MSGGGGAVAGWRVGLVGVCGPGWWWAGGAAGRRGDGSES